jgi:5,10-methenyltetrahydrofolate synthetase
MNSDPENTGSEPCFAHLLVDGHVVDPDTARDVARFRKSERQRLYGLRKDLAAADRHLMSETVSAKLNEVVGDVSNKIIATYWPIRAELNLRNWMTDVHSRGATVALPAVVARDQPVEFHQWSPGCKMQRGIWNIPVPEEARSVSPGVIIAPLLGVDDNRYRLGNGGGYYDRTLASMNSDRLVIGVGQPFARMKTIFPMPWDIAMDVVILGDGTHW